MRVGIGYDSHRFAVGRRLILGGVELEHEAGLEGHFGAGGLGDLGTHFPPDDEAWRDADSLDLLRTVVGMLSGSVANVDATVICEAPKLGAHRGDMERNLSEVLGAPVSVKASTNERMGFIGRAEGIACVAVALVDDLGE